MFWFQGVPFETDQPEEPNRAVMSALLDLYREMAPDLYCFQELQSEATFRALQEALSLPGGYTPGAMLTQYGVGTLWETGRFLSDCREAGDPPQRAWQMVAEAGIRVCNVHLPSGRQLGKAAAGQRVAELAQILAVVPDVIAGDFNEQPGGRMDAFLQEQGYSDAAVLTGKADQPTSIGGGRGDRIWVHDRVQDRLIAYNVLPRAALETAFAGLRYLSDHLPLWIRMHPGGDR